MPYIDVPEGKADPEVRVWALRPEMGMGAGALSHAIYEQSIVPVRERELARMRIAQINGCLICQQWRSTPGAEGAVIEDDYAHVLDWRDARRLLRARAPRDRLRRTVRARSPHHRRRLLRPNARRRLHRRGDPRPDGVHRRMARARPHAARARPRRRLQDRAVDEPMGDLAADTKVTGSVGRFFGAAVARLGDLADRAAVTSRRSRCAPRAQHSQFGRPVSISGHFLGVADLRRRHRRGQDAAPHQARRIDARLDQAESQRDLRSARVDVRDRWKGSSTSSRSARRPSSRSRCRRPRTRLAEAGRRTAVPLLVELRRARRVLADAGRMARTRSRVPCLRTLVPIPARRRSSTICGSTRADRSS